MSEVGISFDNTEEIVDSDSVFFKPDGPLKNEMTFIYVSGILVALWSFVWIGLASDTWSKSGRDDSAIIWENAQIKLYAWGRIGFLFMALFVASQIVWSYKAYRFTEKITGISRKWQRGWTIGGWFVPIGFLFIPFLVIRETESIIMRKQNKYAWAGFAWFSLSWIAIVGRRLISELSPYDGYGFDYSEQSVLYPVYFVTGFALIFSALFAFIYFGDISSEAFSNTPETLTVSSQIKEDTPASKSIEAEVDGSLVGEQIRMLGKLHADGLLSDAEFAEKKTDLLGRI